MYTHKKAWISAHLELNIRLNLRLYLAAHLERLTMCKGEKEQTTTPISLGVVYLSTI